MLTNSLCTTQLGQCLYPPVRGGVGQAAPLKDLRPPGPSGGCALCAPSYQRHQDSSPAPAVVSSRKRLRPLSPLLSLIECQWYAWAQSAVTNTVSAMRPSSLAWSLGAVRAVRRLTQLSCWVVPCLCSSSSAGSVRRAKPLHSAVRLRRVYPWSLFRHTSAGKDPAGSVPGAQGAGVPPAGADIVGLVHSCAVPQTAKDCAGGTVPGLRP